MAEATPAKALVLGGGGTTGIAWETGLLLGLRDGGVDVTDAGLVVGTSAGSVVGAQITTGIDLEALYALQLQPLEQTKEQVVPFDFATLMQVFTAGAGAPDAQTARARVGAAALAVKTMPEAARLEIIAARLPVHEWPHEQRLAITAVDTQTGAWVIFDRNAGVPLTLAVAASCAVPGIYPPITIGEHRYMDGGVRSGTNADIAKGAGRVLIVRAETLDASAMGANIPLLTFEEELAELQQAGSQSLVITPDAASTAARGPNPLDASRRAPSAQAGREQGRSLAESVRRFWTD
ncbi:MAG TPA: patatin-like phospholipase family protein [Ktedonobacteraceae bacterium]|nr:patatin-like phospholipase family protein [Ktedonobacteraceae bacterium]